MTAEERECATCGLVKPLNKANWIRNSKSAKGFLRHCKSCMRERQRDWRLRDPERYTNYQKMGRDERRRLVDSYKAGKPCADCGGTFPSYVMDWDHLDPSDKLFAVGSMVGQRRALEAIEMEIAKCDLICSNCHRIRTWSRAAQ